MRGIRVIAVLAFLWLLSGWSMGFALRVLIGVQWILPCTSINVLIGMLLLLWVTRTAREQQILFEGEERQEDEGSLAALLVGIPVFLIFGAVVFLLIAPFFH